MGDLERVVGQLSGQDAASFHVRRRIRLGQGQELGHQHRRHPHGPETGAGGGVERGVRFRASVRNRWQVGVDRSFRFKASVDRRGRVAGVV